MFSTTQQHGILAAIRRFPTRRQQIEQLAEAQESFCEMCDELGAAELALATVDQLDETVRAERRLEWLCFIGETLAEIEGELQRSNVIPIDRRARPTH